MNNTMSAPDVPDASTSIDEDNADRRTRLRLRELCDEVAASYRLADGRDVLSESERAEARAMLEQLAPRVGRRRNPR